VATDENSDKIYNLYEEMAKVLDFEIEADIFPEEALKKIQNWYKIYGPEGLDILA
jgi:hypothetical protein